MPLSNQPKADVLSPYDGMALAHAVGSDVEQAYRRTDLFNKRRKSAVTGAVVPLRQGAPA